MTLVSDLTRKQSEIQQDLQAKLQLQRQAFREEGQVKK